MVLGLGSLGEIGDGTASQRFPPTQIGRRVAHRRRRRRPHLRPLESDGTLWCWGDNVSGDLGIGSAVRQNVPVEVGTATTWASVTLGAASTCAGRGDGSLSCCGTSTQGEIGDGATRRWHQPGADRRRAAVGRRRAPAATRRVALQSDGSLWCWGYDELGELADDAAWQTTPELSPM